MPPKPDPAAEAEGDEGEEERELIERELAISYLKSKLGKYQQSRDQLAGEVAYLVSELEREKSDHRAIIELLTGQVRASNQRYEDVTIKLQELKAELEDERKRHKKEFDEVSAQKDAEILRLTEKTEQQQDKLKELEEFTKQKDSLQKELENEKLQRAQDDRKWREEKTMLERNFVQEKDRWQKELQHQIKETKAQMMKLMDNQLEITTKRTIMENEQMHSELAYQSRQSEKIAVRNKELADENADLRRQVELAKQTEVELAKRNHVYQKTIKTLLAKVRQESKTTETHGAELQDALDQNQVLENRIHALNITCQELKDELRAAEERMRRMKADSEEWLQKQEAAGLYLMQCIADLAQLSPEAVEPATKGVVELSRDAWSAMTPEERTALLRKLLMSMQVVQPGFLPGTPGTQVERLVLPPVTNTRVGMSKRNMALQDGDKGGADRLSQTMPAQRKVVKSSKWGKAERGSEIMYKSVPGVDDLLAAVTSGKADMALLAMRRAPPAARPMSAGSPTPGPGAGGMQRTSIPRASLRRGVERA